MESLHGAGSLGAIVAILCNVTLHERGAVDEPLQYQDIGSVHERRLEGQLPSEGLRHRRLLFRAVREGARGEEEEKEGEDNEADDRGHRAVSRRGRARGESEVRVVRSKHRMGYAHWRLGRIFAPCLAPPTSFNAWDRTKMPAESLSTPMRIIFPRSGALCFFHRRALLSFRLSTSVPFSLTTTAGSSDSSLTLGFYRLVSLLYAVGRASGALLSPAYALVVLHAFASFRKTTRRSSLD